MDFASHLKIENEPADIHAKMCDQASLYFAVAQKACAAQNEIAALKMRLRSRRADLTLEFSAVKREQKLTEAAIAAQIEKDEAVQTLEKMIREAEGQRLKLDFALEALRQRYGMLKSLGENLREESREPTTRRWES